MIKFKDYLDKRLANDPGLAANFWEGYDEFKTGVILREARQKSGMTQDQVAQKMNTTQSLISRIESHSADIRLSTLEKFVNALGRKLTIVIE